MNPEDHVPDDLVQFVVARDSHFWDPSIINLIPTYLLLLCNDFM